MELNDFLSITGIILNIIGLILIFFYGISPFVDTGGYKMLYSEAVINDSNSRENKRKRIHYRIAIFGLMLSAIGGVMQIISIFC